jgi:leucine-zipper of insertion element IS481
MKLHRSHRSCPGGRRLICRRVLEEGWTLKQAAGAAGCSVRTAAKWLKHFREGDGELLDHSWRPCRSPTRVAPERVRAIEGLRRLWMTAAELAEVLRMPGAIGSPTARGCRGGTGVGWRLMRRVQQTIDSATDRPRRAPDTPQPNADASQGCCA